MTELPVNIHNKLNDAKWDVIHTVEAVNWRLDSNAKEARKELLALDQFVRPDPDSPPKILKIETEDGEYVSIRRIEGRNLYSTTEAEYVFEVKTLFDISSTDLPDGAIGVLLVPAGASCKNDSILEKYPEEEACWSYMEYLLMEGVKYDSKDWKIDYGVTTLIKRIGNEFYLLNREKPDKYDHQPIVDKIKPLKDKINLYTTGMYLSKDEIDTKKEWYDTRARFYALIKGSSMKEMTGKRVRNLTLQTVKTAV